MGKHEVVAVYLGGRLQLAVDPAVALLDPTGIPWQVEVEQVGAVGLEVKALPAASVAISISRVFRGVGIEASLDLFAPRTAGQPIVTSMRSSARSELSMALSRMFLR